MNNIQSHTTSNVNSIAQYASLEALTGQQEEMKIMQMNLIEEERL